MARSPNSRCSKRGLALGRLAARTAGFAMGFAMACAPGPREDQPVADLVFLNGGVYTASEAEPWAEAVAISDGLIVAVGSNDEIEAWGSEATRKIDVTGKMLLPGLHDAHLHPIAGGRAILGCDLAPASTVEELFAAVAECAQDVGPEDWVFGQNFDLSLFPGGNPHRSLLDEVVPNRPVYLGASDGHNGWANTQALEAAGIDRNTVTPDLGVIERDPSGEPSGVLRELAMDLVVSQLPAPSVDDDVRALEEALAHVASLGITSYIDAHLQPRDFEVYQRLEANGGLSARVMTCLTYGAFSEATPAEFEEALEQLEEFESERLRTRAIKLFVDGVLEGRTAALLDPYEGGDHHHGVLNFTAKELREAVARFDARGLQVHLHAIGDGGVREALDAIEAARTANGPSDNRHHISHLQLIAEADLPRFAQLEATANFQALWALPDGWILDINLPDVGPERVDRMYPVASVQRAGGRLVGGSDWPVSSANPLEAIEVALRRQAPGPQGLVLNEAERVDLDTMLAAYTREAAWLMHQEDLVGTIEVGKRADLAVLSRNLFEVPIEEIDETIVEMTVLEGEVIFEAQGDSTTPE